MDLHDVFGTDAPMIGMVHLRPLRGAPGFDGDLDGVRETALRDARALRSGGVDAVMVENFGDAPFYPDDVPKSTVAQMAAIATDIVREIDRPLGVNVLRNDAEAALAVAAATGASFVRVNVHTGARVTDQGVVEGRAHETLRLRDRLDADVKILADVDVKHSAPLAADTAPEPHADTVKRGLADGLVVTGGATGRAVDVDELRAVVDHQRESGLETPVFVGSGVTADTVDTALDVADGVIVGTALKEGDGTAGPIDPAAVEGLVERVRDHRRR